MSKLLLAVLGPLFALVIIITVCQFHYTASRAGHASCSICRQRLQLLVTANSRRMSSFWKTADSLHVLYTGLSLQLMTVEHVGVEDIWLLPNCTAIDISEWKRDTYAHYFVQYRTRFMIRFFVLMFCKSPELNAEFAHRRNTQVARKIDERQQRPNQNQPTTQRPFSGCPRRRHQVIGLLYMHTTLFVRQHNKICPNVTNLQSNPVL